MSVVLRASDFTELDRREITLWRVLGRWEEAQRRGDTQAMAELDKGFRKRLADYRAAVQESRDPQHLVRM